MVKTNTKQHSYMHPHTPATGVNEERRKKRQRRERCTEIDRRIPLLPRLFLARLTGG